MLAKELDFEDRGHDSNPAVMLGSASETGWLMLIVPANPRPVVVRIRQAFEHVLPGTNAWMLLLCIAVELNWDPIK